MEEIIKKYLENRAKTDESVARNLKKANKSIKGCCQYITDQARKAATGNVAMVEDDVVFGWAVHYYDEDKLEQEKQSKPAAVKVIASEKKVRQNKQKYVQCDLFGELGL